MIYVHVQWNSIYIFVTTDSKMDEYDTKEKDVMKILVEVATAKREAEIVSVSQKERSR